MGGKQQSQEPCKKEACGIQARLTKNNFLSLKGQFLYYIFFKSLVDFIMFFYFYSVRWLDLYVGEIWMPVRVYFSWSSNQRDARIKPISHTFALVDRLTK